MKVLLFGGTFDPPHMGHVNNLEAAIRAVEPDKVIIMPAGIPPHKANHKTPGRIRMEMCCCFLPCHDNVEISDWEISREGKSYTIHTIEHLREEYPEDALYMAVGSDMLMTFDQWYHWQDILRQVILVCTSRQPGDDPELLAKAVNLEHQGGRIVLAHAKAVELSSTQIREGGCDPRVLHPLTRKVIEKYGLYHKEVE